MLKYALFFVALALLFVPFHSAFALDGVQRAELKNARLVNAFGEPLSQNININQQLQVSADITNKQNTPQTFVYIVVIQDANEITQKLTWISGSLNSQQTFSPAISWLPNIPGTYTAQIYVWDSIPNASALTRPLQIKFIVS